MTRLSKILFGLVCVAPLGLFCPFVFLAPFFIPRLSPDKPFNPIEFLYPGVLGKIVLVAALVGFALAWVLAVRAFQGKGVPENSKVLWGALLLFGTLAVLPVYWFICVWSEGGSPEQKTS